MKKNSVHVLAVLACLVWAAGCTSFQTGRPSENSSRQGQADAAASPPSANYYYLESRVFIKNRDFDSALVSLEKALELEPSSFVLTRDLAFLYLRQNNTGKAVQLAERLTERDPENIDALLLYVQLKKDDISDDELLETLTRILALDPENKETYLRLGKIYMEKEDYLKALDLFGQMVEYFPDYYVSAFYLGEVYNQLGDYESAQAYFAKSIDLEPDLVEPRFRLIDIYRMDDEAASPQKIINLYEEILDIETDNYKAFMGLALQYYKIGQMEQARDMFAELARNTIEDSRMVLLAIEDDLNDKHYEDLTVIFREMLKTDPQDSTLNFLNGMVYQAADDPKKAIEFYKRVKPDHPQYKKTVLNIAFLYKELDDVKAAVAYLEARHDAFPDDVDFTIYLSSFYESEDQFDNAVGIVEQGLRSDPGNTTLMFRLGALYDKRGRKSETIQLMEKIIELNPKDASALNYLGYTYAEQGVKLDEALALIEKAHEIRPDDGYITDSLGWVYYQKGQYEKAVGFLEEAARLTSFETVIAEHLADAYLKLNRIEEALTTYEKAVSNAGPEDTDKVSEINIKIQLIKNNAK